MKMNDNKKIFLAVLFSVLGFILAIFIVKTIFSSENNYAMYGIILVGLSPLLFKIFKKNTPLVFFLTNFIGTMFLAFLLKYLF